MKLQATINTNKREGKKLFSPLSINYRRVWQPSYKGKINSKYIGIWLTGYEGIVRDVVGVGDDKVGGAAEPEELDPEAEREVVEVVVEGGPAHGVRVGREGAVVLGGNSIGTVLARDRHCKPIEICFEFY